jgi:hypothetical protein
MYRDMQWFWLLHLPVRYRTSLYEIRGSHAGDEGDAVWYIVTSARRSKQHVSPKRSYLSTELHSVKTQEIVTISHPYTDTHNIFCFSVKMYIRRTRVVSFTLPRYLRGNSPRYPLCRRLREPQSQSDRYGEHKKNIMPLPRIEPRSSP